MNETLSKKLDIKQILILIWWTKMKSEAEKSLIMLKKARFLNAVKRAVKSLPINVPIPEVNFDYCNETPVDSIAHIHLDTNTICISEGRLSSMTYEDIEETAFHEVTHIIEENHGDKFNRAYINNKTHSWIQEHSIENTIEEETSEDFCSLVPLDDEMKALVFKRMRENNDKSNINKLDTI